MEGEGKGAVQMVDEIGAPAPVGCLKDRLFICFVRKIQVPAQLPTIADVSLIVAKRHRQRPISVYSSEFSNAALNQRI